MCISTKVSGHKTQGVPSTWKSRGTCPSVHPSICAHPDSVCVCQGKPAIAHRDVKSRNILVMSDGRCCVADLGLAVLQRPPQSGVMPPTSNHLSSVDELKVAAANLKVGTRRCMAPEILDETINIHMFDSYRQADVYSFALVVWEISRRYVVSGRTETAVL